MRMREKIQYESSAHKHLLLRFFCLSVQVYCVHIDQTVA